MYYDREFVNLLLRATYLLTFYLIRAEESDTRKNKWHAIYKLVIRYLGILHKV